MTKSKKKKYDTITRKNIIKFLTKNSMKLDIKTLLSETKNDPNKVFMDVNKKNENE